MTRVLVATDLTQGRRANDYLDLAARLPLGTVVERRGDDIRERVRP